MLLFVQAFIHTGDDGCVLRALMKNVKLDCKGEEIVK